MFFYDKTSRQPAKNSGIFFSSCVEFLHPARLIIITCRKWFFHCLHVKGYKMTRSALLAALLALALTACGQKEEAAPAEAPAAEAPAAPAEAPAAEAPAAPAEAAPAEAAPAEAPAAPAEAK
jgi:predicted small lipoprotein YifL